MITSVSASNKFTLNLDNKYFIKHPKKMLALSGCFAILALVAKTSTVACAFFGAGSALFALGTFYKWRHLCAHVVFGKLHMPYRSTLKQPHFSEEKRHGDATLTICKLDTAQKIPTLDLQEIPTTFCVGYHQGILMAEQLWRLSKQVFPYVNRKIAREHQDPTQFRLSQHALNLSSLYNDELRGISHGVEDWGYHNGVEIDRTEFYSLLFKTTILHDTYKPIGSSSTIVYKDYSNGKIMVARSLEWCSMGSLGKHLHSKLYKVDLGDQKISIWSHTFPGFIGCLTCANSTGLYAFANELGNTTKGVGIPYSYFVKQLIETCSTVNAVEQSIIKAQGTSETSCASSFSLTVVDNFSALAFYFYPGGVNDDLQSTSLNNGDSEAPIDSEFIKIATGVFKRVLPSDGSPLIVTNHASSHKGTYIDRSVSSETSIERYDAVRQEFAATDGLDMATRMKKMLARATESSTIAVYFFDTTAGTVEMGSDNYNAGALIPQLKPSRIF